MRAWERYITGESRLLHFSPAERERVLDVIRGALEAQPGVAFAYAHGSVLTEQSFHDVDIAVYLDTGDENRVSKRVMALTMEVQDAVSQALDLSVHPPIDVRALNFAPLGFCYQALLGGRLLMSHDEVVRTRWVAGIVSRYLDIAPLRRRALKEAMTAWG